MSCLELKKDENMLLFLVWGELEASHIAKSGRTLIHCFSSQLRRFGAREMSSDAHGDGGACIWPDQKAMAREDYTGYFLLSAKIPVPPSYQIYLHQFTSTIRKLSILEYLDSRTAQWCDEHERERYSI